MELVDTHAHLDFPQFDSDREALIAALAAEQIRVINISTSVESISRVVELAKNNPLIWATVGIHPTDVTESLLTEIPSLLEEWAALIKTEPKIVGIGEIGLDYYHDRSSSAAENQKAALRQFLTFALENKLPVSCHCRDAYGDLITILGDYPDLRGVIHCFSGTLEQAEAFLNLNFHLSYTAIIGYPGNDALRTVVKAIPLNRLMLETDCPFLPPADRRGQRNDPRTVRDILDLVADIKQTTPKAVAEATSQTAKKLFNIN